MKHSKVQRRTQTSFAPSWSDLPATASAKLLKTLTFLGIWTSQTAFELNILHQVESSLAIKGSVGPLQEFYGLKQNWHLRPKAVPKATGFFAEMT